MGSIHRPAGCALVNAIYVHCSNLNERVDPRAFPELGNRIPGKTDELSLIASEA